MKTTIDTYRGYEITFDTEKERFTFSLDEVDYCEKQSFTACKTKIDSYIKENSDFKPFTVINLQGETATIIGKTRSGNFSMVKDDIRILVTGSEEAYWFVFTPEIEFQITNYNSLLEIVNDKRKEAEEYRESIPVKTLKSIKSNY